MMPKTVLHTNYPQVIHNTLWILKEQSRILFEGMPLTNCLIQKNYRVCPSPKTMYLEEVNSANPIGPRACSF